MVTVNIFEGIKWSEIEWYVCAFVVWVCIEEEELLMLTRG